MINTEHIYNTGKGILGTILLQATDTLQVEHMQDGEKFKAVCQLVIAICTVISLFWKRKKKD